MNVQRLAIPDLILITPTRLADSRGFFSETWNAKAYAEAGIPSTFVQDNHSLSREQGVLRGLHLQIPPYAQGKLVRCSHGSIWDVAIDVRRDSPTYGRHAAVVLSGENWQQLWIPPGFLHGFCTLAPESEVIYKVTAEYNRESERGVIWNDPDLRIAWPLGPHEALLSKKDSELPRFRDCPTWFTN
jgi:dTDP-4-dehydrorhamnose 3,5-epimerase